MRTVLKIGLTILLPILPFFAHRASGATVWVPADQPTIQAGIDVTADGDLVMVAPGTYVENIQFPGSRAITLQSEQGAEETVIDGSQNGSVVTLSDMEAEGAILQGFTIRNGSGTYSPHYDDYLGGGIYCSNSPYSYIEIISCTLIGNTAYRGGGIDINSAQNLTIEACTITANNAGSGGGGIYYTISDPMIVNCTISDNKAAGKGGGIFCDAASYSTIMNCTISGNHSEQGGGIFCWNSFPTITSSRILRNIAEESGGGIECNVNTFCLIETCTISVNIADGYGGGGIFCINDSSSIKNCIITGNRGHSCGGGILCNGSSPTITNCTISGNIAGGYGGGGIYCFFAGRLAISNCILWGNRSPRGPEIAMDPFTELTVNYSDVRGGYEAVSVGPRCRLIWDVGNMDQNPLFVGGEDYHLRAISPCIDAGSDEGVYSDIDGDSRPQGPGFDMGADEFVPGPCFIGEAIK